MNVWQRIAREPNAIAGVLVAGYGLLVAFDVIVLTATQFGAVTAFGGAVVFLLRWLVTPSAEVVVQKKPDDVTQTAGPAADVETGAPVHAQITKILGKA
jgi:hypothetical protein